MTLEMVILFIGVMFIATITPGPATLFMLEAGTKYRSRELAMCILSISLSAVSFALAAIFGLSAVMMQYAEAYQIIRIVGGIYLIWIGIGRVRAMLKYKQQEDGFELSNQKSKNPVKEAFLIGISNPKGIIFFAAVFPQFIPVQSVMTDYLVLLMVTFITGMMCLSLYALFGTRLAGLFKKKTFRKAFEGFNGVFFMLFGGLLALGGSKA